MSEKPYPLFIPPDGLCEKTPMEWTAKEAKAYCNWFLSVLDQRVSDMLIYFDEKLTGNAEEDLKRIGEKVALALKSPQFSYMAKAEPIVFKHGDKTLVSPPLTEMEPKLTNAGAALAADMGLLVAKLLFDAYQPKFTWVLHKGGKTNIDYNHVVLSGIKNIPLEPIGASISKAYSILRGKKSFLAWQDLFSYYKNKISQDG